MTLYCQKVTLYTLFTVESIEEIRKIHRNCVGELQKNTCINDPENSENGTSNNVHDTVCKAQNHKNESFTLPYHGLSDLPKSIRRKNDSCIQLSSYYAAIDQFNFLKDFERDPGFKNVEIVKVYDLRLNPKYQCKQNIKNEIDRLTKGLEAWQLREEMGQTAKSKW